MRNSHLLSLAALVFSVSIASQASAREGARVAGAHAAERPTAAAAWTPIAGGRMHAGWQLSCPSGCTIDTTSARVRLDETTTVRDLEAPFVQRDGGELDEVSASFEIIEGGATAEVSPGKRPVLLQSTGGGQLVVNAARSGRLVSRAGRDAFAAMDGDAELRAPGQRWSPLAAGSMVFARAGRFGAVQTLAPAPAWAPLSPDAGPSAIADERGKPVSGAAWTPDPNAVAYRVEIARDARFSNMIRSGETPYCSFGEKLPVGTYFVRVRAIDSNALESRASATRSLRIVAAVPGA